MGLVEDAVEARRLGQSYGTYMPTKGAPSPLVRYEGPICLHCGKPLPEGRRKFCSRSCSNKRRYNRRKAAVFV